MTDAIVVLITAPPGEQAEKIARTVVEERLAACVNMVEHVRSIYRWQGSIEDEREVLLIAKTRSELFPRLKERVVELHSYTVPEILAVPVTDGLKSYLDWLLTETH